MSAPPSVTRVAHDQVCVTAIMNCGAREDSTRIGSGGVVRRQVSVLSCCNTLRAF